VDDRFFTACFPGSVRICGRTLNDFTPFHYLLLKAVESPFLALNGVNRPADLLAAIAACRNRFGFPVKIRPTLRDLVWRIRMERNADLFKREAVKFSLWLSNHSSGPRFWEIVSGGPKTRDLTGPDILTLVVPLLMKTGMNEDQVWNMSLGRAQWINAEIQEIDGSDRRFLFDDDLTEELPDNA
jgi:hypothetical protein